MKKLLLALVLVTPTLLVGTTKAQSFEQIGQYLKDGCKVAVNGNNGWWGGSDSFEWICNIANSYGFMADNIINGDWEEFGKELIGRYTSDLVGHIANQMGAKQLNKYTDDLYQGLTQSYGEFRQALMNAMGKALKDQANGQFHDDNKGFSVVTPGGLADFAANNNPNLAIAQQAGRFQRTADAFEELAKAAKGKKLTEQNLENIATTVEPALSSAGSIIGTPVKKGIADTFVEKGKTALSTREVQQVQLEAFGEYMKQDASFRVIELQVLTEIAKQGVMQNTQLLMKLNEAESALSEARNELKEQLELIASENLEQAGEAARQLASVMHSFNSLVNPGSNVNGNLDDFLGTP
ncbi:hypothetical protein [Deinococcus cellulosilyticus]|uniref:Uncharacterized protein n=1 Tax=Deinococcus cellulosilyticus (strain DSM 18568 / NBRC 106333 / KACC 11606 / 5516J-15) TaxID=1223518 RepID=A0A511NB90_DEIC1|nr:hypothetical protein [Deinococcus cellulosilyticus]GEM49826.1 hypothetical protein DC3_54610 [Deinococcus cellulosilyticus NBRC 106333 = KACC 11606]